MSELEGCNPKDGERSRFEEVCRELAVCGSEMARRDRLPGMELEMQPERTPIFSSYLGDSVLHPDSRRQSWPRKSRCRRVVWTAGQGRNESREETSGLPFRSPEIRCS